MSISINVSTGGSWLEQALWRNRLLLCLAALHLAAGVTVSAFADVSPNTGTFMIILVVLKALSIVFAINLLLWRFGYGVLKVRPKRPIQWLIGDLRRTLSDAELMADAVIAFVAITVVASTFTYLKDMITVLHPFSWDFALAELDRTLHGGTDPWRLLLPVFGSPVMTTMLNAAYHVWFALLYLCVFIAAFDQRDPVRRNQFLVAFVLVWAIGGNMIATVMSSAGPVYYQALGFGDTFAEQMRGLEAMHRISPVWALDIQDMLLWNYQNDGPIKGISAFPSMHVATSALMALFGFSYARWLGWALTAFAGFILIGSVHLGWHYASDGYFGVVLTLCCWCVAKKLAERYS